MLVGNMGPFLYGDVSVMVVAVVDLVHDVEATSEYFIGLDSNRPIFDIWTPFAFI